MVSLLRIIFNYLWNVCYALFTELSMNPTSLKEISARVVKTCSIPFSGEDLPRTVIEYLSSANCCVNPECKGENDESSQRWDSIDKVSSVRWTYFPRVNSRRWYRWQVLIRVISEFNFLHAELQNLFGLDMKITKKILHAKKRELIWHPVDNSNNKTFLNVSTFLTFLLL